MIHLAELNKEKLLEMKTKYNIAHAIETITILD